MKRKRTKVKRSAAEIARLVEENLSLAHHFAKQWYWRDYNEALSLALDGLWVAAQNFKPARKIPFGSYASLRIKWRECAHRRHESRGKRGGGTAVHVPLDAEIAHESSSTVGSLMAADVAPPDVELLAREDDALVSALLGRLNARQRLVLTQRYGLDGAPARSLAEVGAQLGVTGERVRQLEVEALGRLRGRRACRAELSEAWGWSLTT